MDVPMSLAALIVTVATDCEITRHKSLRVGAGKDALMDRREFDERLGSAAQKLASYLDRHHHPSKTGSSWKTYRVLNESRASSKLSSRRNLFVALSAIIRRRCALSS
jgi:hypothetical protein